MAFPTALSVLVDDSAPGIHDGSAITADLINNLETKIGINSSAVATSLDYLLKNPLSINPGHKHSELWASDGSPQAVWVDAAGQVGFGVAAPISLVELQGGLTTVGAVLTLSSQELTVDANDVLGRINFRAALESSGTDAILAGASIAALAEASFTSTVNATSLIFATGASEVAVERMRITSLGNVGIGMTSFGSSAAKVLSLGTGTAPGSSVADSFQMYSADQAAGNACPTFRTENGAIIKLYAANAYTQTYSTADRTVPNATASNPPAGGTGATAGAYDNATHRNEMITSLTNCIADVLALKKVVNAIIDDLQAVGLIT